MLTIKDFTTKQEELVNLLSVATFGNEWPVIKAFKSDAESGMFEDCDCREDKWAKALLKGKGVIVYDFYDENVDDAVYNGEVAFPAEAKHKITIEDVIQPGFNFIDVALFFLNNAKDAYQGYLDEIK